MMNSLNLPGPTKNNWCFNFIHLLTLFVRIKVEINYAFKLVFEFCNDSLYTFHSYVTE